MSPRANLSSRIESAVDVRLPLRGVRVLSPATAKATNPPQNSNIHRTQKPPACHIITISRAAYSAWIWRSVPKRSAMSMQV